MSTAAARTARLMLAILGIALVVSIGISGDTKKDKDREPRLPPGWNALMLSAEQRARVIAILADYRLKLEPLEKKIAALKTAEKQELLKVLTKEQREAYLRGSLGDDKPRKGEKDKDKN